MPSDSTQPANSPGEPIPGEQVYRLYSALASTILLDAQSGLGGKLLYAGEINSQGRDLLFAANIAGAASLAASADPATQRQAIRDGVVDFMVTSLEEALRILKNEIRKRQTVSVGVGTNPQVLADQMLDRGVLPDLLPPFSTDFAPGLDGVQMEKFLAMGGRPIPWPGDAAPDGLNTDGLIPDRLDAGQGKFVTWSVDQHFARWLPRLDSCALAVVPAHDNLRRRWLALAPRYLGRLAQRQHGVVFSDQETASFRAKIDELLARQSDTGEQRVQVTISGLDPQKQVSVFGAEGTAIPS